MSSMIEYKVTIDNFKIFDVDNELIDNEKISYLKILLINEKSVYFNVLLKPTEEENNIFILDLSSKEELCESEFMRAAEKISKDL